MIRTAILAVAALFALSLNAEAMCAVYLLIADADGQGAPNQHWAYCFSRCLRERYGKSERYSTARYGLR